MLKEKSRILHLEERRRQREAKKFGKQVQTQKLQERAKQRKSDMDVIKKWRKERSQNKNNRDDEFPVELLANPGKKGATQNNGANKKETNSKKRKRNQMTKREKKDAKYGFGGKKSGKKRNTAESAADMSGYSVARNKAPYPQQRTNHAPKAKKRKMKKRQKTRG